MRGVKVFLHNKYGSENKIKCKITNTHLQRFLLLCAPRLHLYSLHYIDFGINLYVTFSWSVVPKIQNMSFMMYDMIIYIYDFWRDLYKTVLIELCSFLV